MIIFFTTFQNFCGDFNRQKKCKIITLQRVCLTGNIDLFGKLLTKGGVIERLCDGKTALHMVCIGQRNVANRKEMIKSIVNLTGNTNPVDKKGATPLHIACSNGNLELVKLLVSYKSTTLSARELKFNQPLQNVLAANIPLNAKYSITQILIETGKEKAHNLTGIINEDNNISLQQVLFILNQHLYEDTNIKYWLVRNILENTSSNALNWQNKKGQTSLHALLSTLQQNSFPIDFVQYFAYEMIKKGANTKISDDENHLPINFIFDYTPKNNCEAHNYAILNNVLNPHNN